jgi:hypothetical protein
MPLDSAIQNIGEFYSNHYLDVLLQGDLKVVRAKWKDEEGSGLSKTAPPRRLAALAGKYFRAKGQARETTQPDTRYEASTGIQREIITALGYDVSCPESVWLERPASGTVITAEVKNSAVPLLARVRRQEADYLWVIESRFVFDDDSDRGLSDSHLMDAALAPAQQILSEDQSGVSPVLPVDSLTDLVTRCFRQSAPPRWVMLVGGGDVRLAERTKWGEGRYLTFNFDELLSRKDLKGMEAAAALLSKDTLAPGDGVVLHDTLEENSHKHAFSVSEDLKFSVREAVELLANEWVHYQRTVKKTKMYQPEIAGKLSAECLRYLYRLLFIFFAESRGDSLGVLPANDELYLKGYSLDCLRELEQTALTTDDTRNGYFFHDTIARLFRMLHQGYTPGSKQLALSGDEHQIYEGFEIPGVGGTLFDPSWTPLLSGIRIRNITLQQVIEKLSLTRPQRGKVRGRISYAQLGINQLGAVYEGLLSYNGFFAETKVWAVKEESKSLNDEKTQLFFVPESELPKYKKDELVWLDLETRELCDYGQRAGGARNKPATERRLQPRVWEQGDFVFHLAGRDRQRSASYYTPEVLTRCVVKYSLQELLREEEYGTTWKADDILELSVLEPALGSGAFLNEAVNQLSDLYLKKKQAETGLSISPDEFRVERQKVKAHLVVNCCYGVDLNPVAVELAEVSLWLNSLIIGQPAPYFGLHLKNGNSLVGARRATYPTRLLTQKKVAEKWFRHEPRALKWEEKRPPGHVYHFLLPDAGMVKYEGNPVVKQLAANELSRSRRWKTEFLKPFTNAEIKLLDRLCDGFDELLQKAAKERKQAALKVRSVIPLFGQAASKAAWPDNPDLARQHLERADGPSCRLSMALDAWCALWFWPIDKADSLPSRADWLRTMAILLCGEVPASKDLVQQTLIPDKKKQELPLRLSTMRGYGKVVVDDVVKEIGWLETVQRVAQRQHFHHWEVAFANVFEERGGFDLILGNPPWVLLSFDEAGVVSDFEPLASTRQMSAKEVADLALQWAERPEFASTYTEEFVSQTAPKTFLGARVSYPLLTGMKANLYKCFVTKSWELGGRTGVTGLLHPEGVYDDPGGGNLRKALYARLAGHVQFINELLLFPDIHHLNKYSANISRISAVGEVAFWHMSNAFHPTTLDRSMTHDGHGEVPGIKTAQGQWDVRPHRDRIVHVDESRLKTFVRLYDEPGTHWYQARLPVVHGEQIMRVLEKLSARPRRLADLGGSFFATQHWNETTAQKDGTIRRQTEYARHSKGWILSGPHLYVGTPLNKTPNDGCSHNQDYSSIDLTAIPDDYYPRTNYVPSCSPNEYHRRTPRWNGRPVTEYYRHVHREMVSPTGERTLVPCIVPPGVGHVNTLLGICFDNIDNLLLFSALASTVVADFYMKTTGMGHINIGLASRLPLLEPGAQLSAMLKVRTFRLNSVVTGFQPLWEMSNPIIYGQLKWTKNDPRMVVSAGAKKGYLEAWSADIPLRVDYERRQALVELDALAALALGLTEEELLTIYRIQFPVLQQYERTNRYDQTGRLVPRAVLGMAEQHGINIHQPLTLATYRGPVDEVGEVNTPGLGVTGGIKWEDPKMEPLMERVYPPPFTKCDREEDMSQAYRVFLDRLNMKEPS